MRADATHRYEFESVSGRPFACLARTREEAQQLADARASGTDDRPARFVAREPLAADAGDAGARGTFLHSAFGQAQWRDDARQLTGALDAVRFGLARDCSVLPVSFLTTTELRARRLQACGCGSANCYPRTITGSQELMHPVEPTGAITVEMSEAGGWRLMLWLGEQLQPDAAEVCRAGWHAVHSHGPAIAGTQQLPPATSVWTVANEIFDQFARFADLRPGEMSSVAI